MKLAVYCGSRSGDSVRYEQAGRELGNWMGERKYTLVYGAGFKGIMGAVSSAVQEKGGSIIGVIPQFMIDEGWQKTDLELIQEEELPKNEDLNGRCVMLVTDSMATRKMKMLELCDACITLPGGPGTLEEVTEVISLSCVNQHEKECYVLNLDGYYDALKKMYEDMLCHGFTERSLLCHVHFCGSVQEIEESITGREKCHR